MHLPVPFIDAFIARHGEEEFFSYSDCFRDPAPVSIRINTLKWSERLPNEPVPWAANGYYFDARPEFACDPLWHSGVYYVQEASSMLIAQAFQALELETSHPRVLDLCGAPGGKATHLATLLDGHGLLVANEVIRSRTSVLLENLRKWGYPNILVTGNDPADFGKRTPGFFDVVVVDAPCSGEGLFRKNPGATQEWSLQNVALCAERQKRIVSDIWPAIKPGGYLIYSTCTFNALENETNIQWLMDKEGAVSVNLHVPEAWNFTTEGIQGLYGYHLYPHKVKGEGFFIAVVRKTNGDVRKLSAKKDLRTMNLISKKVLSPEVLFMDDFALVEVGKQVYAMIPRLLGDTDYLRSNLNVIFQGLGIGMISQGLLVPDHDFFCSPFCSPEYFPDYVMSADEALAFVSKGLFLPGGLDRGVRYRARYRGVVTGGFKYMGNRVNTSFPGNWRLRKKCSLTENIL